MHPNLDTAALFVIVLGVCAVVYLHTSANLQKPHRQHAHTLLVVVVPLVATAMTLTTVDPLPLLLGLFESVASAGGPAG